MDRAASSHANQEISKFSLHWHYVVGGVGDEHVLAVIITEVMNTASGQWLTAINLPEPMYFGSLIRTNNQIYMIGKM